MRSAYLCQLVVHVERYRLLGGYPYLPPSDRSFGSPDPHET